MRKTGSTLYRTYQTQPSKFSLAKQHSAPWHAGHLHSSTAHGELQRTRSLACTRMATYGNISETFAQKPVVFNFGDSCTAHSSDCYTLLTCSQLETQAELLEPSIIRQRSAAQGRTRSPDTSKPHHPSHANATSREVRTTLLCVRGPNHWHRITNNAHHHACTGGAPSASPYEWSRGMVVGRGPIMAASGDTEGEVGPRAPPYGSSCPAASACTLAAGTGSRGERATPHTKVAVQYNAQVHC